MRILVTGGAGYLGSTLATQLVQGGHQVRVFDNLTFGGRSVIHLVGEGGFEFIRGDMRDTDRLRSAVKGVDGVVHLAAIVGDPACSKQPELAKAVNVDASDKLIDVARENGVQRFVFASTCSNYGKMIETSILATEQHELRPVSLYAETKVGVERKLLSGVPDAIAKTVLRFATLYGLSPRMRFDLTVNQFAMEMFTLRRLTVFGELFWRPYVHVKDAARAIVQVLNASRDLVAGHVFNVGDTEENYRKLDLVEIVQRRVADVKVEYVHKNEDPRDYKVSFERIRSGLGFAVTRRVPDGVNEIIAALESGILSDPENPFYYNVNP